MSRDEIARTLAETLAETVGVDPTSVSEEKVLADDLDVDSLALVETLVVLDEKLGVRIPDEAVGELRTVGDVITYIEKVTVSTI